MRRRNYPIGIEDFQKVRQLGLEYVDKTGLIREILDRPGTEVFLLPWPRRFGKSLNLSMLRYYFERSPEDRAALFSDLSIWGAGERYRAHFGRYPVITLNFKGVSVDSADLCLESMRLRIGQAYKEHRYLLQSPTLIPVERRRFEEVLEGRASDPVYYASLHQLCELLHRHHGQRAVVLIDEYDAPIHSFVIVMRGKEVWVKKGRGPARRSRAASPGKRS